MKGRIMKRDFNRRRFLAAAGGATAMLLPGVLPAGANSPINCGVIGVGGRGTALLRLALKMPQVRITALCDIEASHLGRGQSLVEQSGQSKPPGYGEKGEFDYRRMLEQKDLDAVIVATPMDDHAVMSIDALRAGKAVLSEVAAATTMEECWGLVRAVEETGQLYMLSENVCYFRNLMIVSNMIRQGLFGRLTFGECGYVHDCRFLHFKPDGTLTWRGEFVRKHVGNWYPTHAIGPIAQWMGINKTDRFTSLVSMATPSVGARHDAVKRFGPDSPQAKTAFAMGDSVTTLIQTATGAVIDLRCDTLSSRPHRTTTYHTIQGETGSYQSPRGDVWLESRSKSYKWDSLDQYAEEFDDPLWKRWEQEAKASGHGGADFFALKQFFDALRNNTPSPIDVYDAAAWSCIVPLSAESIRQGSARLEIPDFTGGRVEVSHTG
jgi:predicted dehydrogenase